MSQIMIYVFRHAEKSGRNERIEQAWLQYTGCAEAADRILIKDDKGCPHVQVRPEVYVSITDCEEYWLIAFADQRIGIDLQKMEAPYMSREKDTESRCRKLATRFFYPAEADYVCAADSTEEIRRRFFELWTAKEAYVKWTGTGIDNSFSEFNVLDPEIYPMMHWMDLKKDYAFCICCETDAEITIIEQE